MSRSFDILFVQYINMFENINKPYKIVINDVSIFLRLMSWCDFTYILWYNFREVLNATSIHQFPPQL